MKKIFCLILVLFIVNYHPTKACLNGPHKILKNGEYLYVDLETSIPQGHDVVNKEYLERLILKIDSLYNSTKDIDYLSDKGLVLIYLGRYQEAIDLYLKIEKIKPNSYTTASNLGTTYELIGKNEDALKWIQKSVKLDPKSHNGSEWIHINILKAKIKGDDFINSDFLINQNFGNDSIPVTSLSTEKIMELKQMVLFQLNERMTFIKSNDKIIAQLLFDIGNLAFLVGHYNEAYADYELALRYGYVSEILTKRKQISSIELHKTKPQTSSNVKKDKAQFPIEKWWTNNLIISIVASIVLSILVTLIINLIRRNRR